MIAARGLHQRRAVAFRVLLGLAAVVYGAGQVMVGASVASGGAVFPTAGDILSTFSVPIAIAGLAMLPRRADEANPGSRLALEATLLGAAAALLLWRVAFRAAWPLVVTGMSMVSTAPPQLADAAVPGAESRRTLVASVTASVLLIVFAVGLIADPSLDPVEVGLVILVVLAYAGGEVVRARQATRLLTRVSAQALTDPLTGLGNRRALTDALSVGGRLRIVLTLDLDGFKGVNGLVGHSGGDVLLVGVADRMRRICAEHGAQAFRLGGDEFAVVAGTALAGAERLGTLLVEAVVGVWREVPAAAAVDLSAYVGLAR